MLLKSWSSISLSVSSQILCNSSYETSYLSFWSCSSSAYTRSLQASSSWNLANNSAFSVWASISCWETSIFWNFSVSSAEFKLFSFSLAWFVKEICSRWICLIVSCYDWIFSVCWLFVCCCNFNLPLICSVLFCSCSILSYACSKFSLFWIKSASSFINFYSYSLISRSIWYFCAYYSSN